MRALFPASIPLAPREREPIHVVRRPRRASGPTRRLTTGARVVHRAARRHARRLFLAPLSEGIATEGMSREGRRILVWGGTSIALHLLALVPALRQPSPAPPLTVEQLRFIAPLLPKRAPAPSPAELGEGGVLRFQGPGTGLGALAEAPRDGQAPTGTGGGDGRAAGRAAVLPAEAPMDGQDSSTVYSAIDVDREVERAPDAAGPIYPETLRLNGTQGQVLVEFVVDVDGRVDLATVRIVEATHPLFGDAVRTSLGETRFNPAKRAGIAVRQRALQTFAFRLQPAGADSTAGRAPTAAAAPAPRTLAADTPSARQPAPPPHDAPPPDRVPPPVP